MLYIFGGLPGSGKTTLSRKLARQLRAVHVRVDTIEQTLRDFSAFDDGPEGYFLAYRIAADNLSLNLDVVADSVNPLGITREAWRDVARQAGVAFKEVEITCSNAVEHRQRVESRSVDIERLRLPTWHDVAHRAYEPWDEPHLVLDTAGRTIDASFLELQRRLQLAGGGVSPSR